MKKRTKKILFLVSLLGILFLLSGCTAPMVTDPETGKKVVKLITTSTTFQEIFKSESWFSALFVYPMAQAINYLSPYLTVAGAIAAITVTVNAAVMMLTKKSTIASQKMQELQPEIDKINKKYEGKKDDHSKMALQKEIQAVYAKYNVNPFAMMGTMFIQLPILLSIYQAVQRSYAVQNGSLFGLSLKTTPWDGVFIEHQYLYILLFLVMLVFQFGSMYLPQYLAKQKAMKVAAEKGKKYTPAPSKTGNMMYFMMAPIMILAVTWPAAMTVYWTINSLTTIAKTLIVQKYFIDKKAA